MVMLKVNIRLIVEKFSHLTWEECGPCPDFACYTLAFALQLREKAWNKPQPGSKSVRWAQLNVLKWLPVGVARTS